MIWMGKNDAMSDESVAALDAAADRNEAVAISAISAWEIGMLSSKGRFASTLYPQAWFDDFVRGGNFRIAPLPPEVLAASSYLPGEPPKDPIDRIIIASARHEKLTLVTRDRPILQYARAGHIRVIEC
nr:PIN domain protein [uncultured bacterium]